MPKIHFKSAWKIFFIALFLFAVETFILKQKIAFGRTFDFLLVIAFVSPIFLNFSEFIFFEVFIIWFFRLMYPFSGMEIFLIAILPACVFFIKKIFLLQPWVEPFAAVFFGISVFYAFTASGFGSMAFLFLDIAISMGFSWIFYLMMRYVFKERQNL